MQLFRPFLAFLCDNKNENMTCDVLLSFHVRIRWNFSFSSYALYMPMSFQYSSFMVDMFRLEENLGKLGETFDRKRKFVMEFSSLGGSYYTLSDKNLSLIILWNLFLGLLAHITFDTSALIKNMYETESKMSIELLQGSFFHVSARFRLIEFDRKTSFFRAMWRHKLRLVSSSSSSSLRILSETKSVTLKINCTLEFDASTVINSAPFHQNSSLNKLLHAFRSMQNILTRKKQKKNIIKATQNMFLLFSKLHNRKGIQYFRKGLKIFLFLQKGFRSKKDELFMKCNKILK